MPAMCELEFLGTTRNLIDERLKLVPAGDLGGISENLLTLACRHLCISDNAKRVRPLLCLYYHWMLSKEHAPKLASIGVAAEFIHAASLLHDDIIDEAALRRGKPSVNHSFGNATAVLAGDFLLTEAFELLRPFDRAISEQAIVVVREMTKASILEVDGRRKIEVSLERWRAVASGKTGFLFSWCGFAVGHFCEQKDAADLLWKAGQHIGIIFQLADDLKDFHGDRNLKDVCRDIRNFESSLPIILAINHDEKAKAQFAAAYAQGFIDDEQAINLRELVLKSGAVKKALAILSREMACLLDLLHVFNDTLGKKRFDALVLDLTKVGLQSDGLVLV